MQTWSLYLVHLKSNFGLASCKRSRVDFCEDIASGMGPSGHVVTLTHACSPWPTVDSIDVRRARTDVDGNFFASDAFIVAPWRSALHKLPDCQISSMQGADVSRCTISVA